MGFKKTKQFYSKVGRSHLWRVKKNLNRFFLIFKLFIKIFLCLKVLVFSCLAMTIIAALNEGLKLFRNRFTFSPKNNKIQTFEMQEKLLEKKQTLYLR